MLTTTVDHENRKCTLEPGERDRLLQENLPEVRFIARRMQSRLPAHVSLDDLVHAGILGLIDAVDRYDPTRNVLLKSYARFRIRGSILDSLRQLDWSPRALRRQARQIEEAQRILRVELGRAPLENEVSARLQMSLEQYQQTLGDLRGLDIGSLPASSSEESPENPYPSLTATEEDDPFQLCLQSEIRSMLVGAIQELEQKERRLLDLYYREEMTMRGVGVILSIGESRVSQIHTVAIQKLRGRMRAKIQGEPATRPCNETHGKTISMERNRQVGR